MTKILVIDDDFENREILRTRLEQAGYDVCEATNGEEGLTATQHEKPNIIILDGMMPKMDGWRVCRTLKMDPLTKNIPILMLTARIHQMDELRGFESGVEEYLTKPCDHVKLLDIVGRYCPKLPGP